MRALKFAILGLCCLSLLALIGFGAWKWYESTKAKELERAKHALEQNRPSPAKRIPPPAKISTEERVKLATVQRAEGFEHPLIRQLAVQAKEYGFTGDDNDAAAVKSWAQRKAHQMAVAFGKYDSKFGAEVRVRYPGVVYLLAKDKDGKPQIQEFAGQKQSVVTIAVSTDGTAASSSGQPHLAKTSGGSAATSSFDAEGGTHLPPYEYLYLGDESFVAGMSG